MNNSLLGFLALIGGLIMCTLFGCHAPAPQSTGVTQGQLAPCPDSPNCVSSQAQKKSQKVDPIAMAEPLATAKAKMKTILNQLGQNKIVQEDPNYLHVEFTSMIFRFVDDIEFYFDTDHKLIHLRSASRTGRYDFGVNRKRMNDINFRYIQM